MRKRILYTFIIFLIAIAIMPWIEGALFKSKYLHLIEVINQDNRAEIKVISYQQGWLHSSAKIFVTLNKALIKLYQISITQANTPIGFTVEEKISHGPLIYDRFSNAFNLAHAKIQNDIYLPKEIQTTLFGNLTTNDMLRVDIISKFDGDWTGEINVPTFSLSIPNLGNLTWFGLTGSFNIILADHYFKSTNFVAKLGSFILKSSSQDTSIRSIETDPIKYKYSASYDDVGLFSGTTNAYTHTISIIKTNETKIIGKSVAIHTAFNMDRRTFYAGNLSINIKDLNISSNIIPAIQPLHMLITVNNFSIKGLLSYLDNISVNTPEAMQKINVNTAEGLLMHMITPESFIEGDLSLNSSLGGLTSHFKSTLRSDVPPPSTFHDLIASLSTTANFVISPSVMQKIVELYNDKIFVSKTSQGTVAKFLTKPQTITVPASMTSKLTPIPATNQSSNLSAKQIVEDLLYGGYLAKDDNNNYITDLTIKSGEWKLNGRIVNYK